MKHLDNQIKAELRNGVLTVSWHGLYNDSEWAEHSMVFSRAEYGGKRISWSRIKVVCVEGFDITSNSPIDVCSEIAHYGK